MYEVSPERGYESLAGAAVAAVAPRREPEILVPAVGDDGAELGVHGAGLSIVDTVHVRVD
jgi:hypothetical protein